MSLRRCIMYDVLVDIMSVSNQKIKYMLFLIHEKRSNFDFELFIRLYVV